MTRTQQQAAAKGTSQWRRLNRKRGKLIDKRIANTLTPAEAELLEALTAYAIEHLALFALRPRLDRAMDELLRWWRGGNRSAETVALLREYFGEIPE